MPVLQAVTGVASQFDLTERPCSPVSAWYPQLVAGEDAGTSRNDREEVVPGSPGVPVETDHYIAPGTGGHGRARVDALLPVIAAYGSRVAVFRYNETRGDKFLIVIAPRPALDALEILLPSLALQMEREARRAARAYAASVREALPQVDTAALRRAPVTPYFREYLRGFGLGVSDQIRSLRTETMTAMGARLARILASHEIRVDETFNRKFPDQQPLRPGHAGHTAARRDGIDAGHAADLGGGYLACHDLYFAML